MKLPRRAFLHLAAGAATLPLATSVACALDYPTRPVHLVTPYPAGGPADIHARLIGQALSERLGKPFVIDNRPGANGNIGTEVVVNAPGDGYTILLIGAFNTFNTALYENLNFVFIRDIAPVASISRNPFVMVVSPSVPAGTVPDFIAYARANPGKLNMGSGGIGSPHHVAGELFMAMTGVNMVHVPFRGDAPLISALLNGQVQVSFPPITVSLEYIRGGKLRALAVTTATRQDVLPGIPTVAEFVPGYEASGWLGIGAPKSTPTAIVDRLNGEINAVLTDPEIRAKLASFGDTVLALSPAEFAELIAKDTDKWGKVIRAANIKPE